MSSSVSRASPRARRGCPLVGWICPVAASLLVPCFASATKHPSAASLRIRPRAYRVVLHPFSRHVAYCSSASPSPHRDRAAETICPTRVGATHRMQPAPRRRLATLMPFPSCPGARWRNRCNMENICFGLDYRCKMSYYTMGNRNLFLKMRFLLPHYMIPK